MRAAFEEEQNSQMCFNRMHKVCIVQMKEICIRINLDLTV